MLHTALPFQQVVDALSRHFLSFESDSRVMPLIWHISLLVFVQRYKHQLTTADRDALQHLTTVQHHYKVRAEGPQNRASPCQQERCLSLSLLACGVPGDRHVNTTVIEHMHSRFWGLLNRCLT